MAAMLSRLGGRGYRVREAQTFFGDEGGDFANDTDFDTDIDTDLDDDATKAIVNP